MKAKTINRVSDNIILIFILLIASMLRLWKFWDLDFMHDELSALSRLDYDSLSDFYRLGVEVDGHPAGIQSYLKFHKWIFGIDVFGIKFPFILCGILSVYQVYKIGSVWFSKSTGLFSTAFISVIQYSIFYDTIIRPYGPGLLLSLLLLRVWGDVFFYKKYAWKNFILFGIYLAALGYVHYFALLFGVLVSLLGLFWVKKEFLFKYVLAGVLGFLLYSPHLGIFFSQVGYGGLIWLGEPDGVFIKNYFFYFFNYSVLFCFSILSGLFFFLRKDTRSKLLVESKKKFVLIFLFVSPFLIGFFYSVLVMPVLQFSVLLFSFPCVLILFFSFWKVESGKVSFLIVLIIMTLGIYSLNSERNHFEVYFDQPVKSFIDLTLEESGYKLNVGYHENVFLNQYESILGLSNIEYYSFDEDCLLVSEFQEKLQLGLYDKVIGTDLLPAQFGLAKCYYPNVKYLHQGVGYENSIFSKEESIDSTYFKFGPWNNKSNFKFNKILSKEYLASSIWKPQEIMKSPYDIVEFYAELEVDTLLDNKVVLAVNSFKGNKPLKWVGRSSLKQAGKGMSKFYLVTTFNIPYKHNSLEADKLKASIWNVNKTPVKIHQLGYRVRAGNPNRFAIYTPYR
ncbi:glycosyltransferase family 39 protein [bacterium]|nr:glycosyltransferase family 39 protein [bacterium]